MIFDLDQAEGERFPFFTSTIDPSTSIIAYDEPGDAWVELRPMQPFFEERLSKRKKISEHVHNPKTRQLERISYFPDLSVEDARKERDDAWDYAITGFGNFKDKTGQVIAFNRDNKLKMIKSPVFIRFCERCFEVMANSGVTKEAEEKNSLPGSSFKTPRQKEAWNAMMVQSFRRAISAGECGRNETSEGLKAIHPVMIAGWIFYRKIKTRNRFFILSAIN